MMRNQFIRENIAVISIFLFFIVVVTFFSISADAFFSKIGTIIIILSCLDKEEKMLVVFPGIFSAKLKLECFSSWQK